MPFRSTPAVVAGLAILLSYAAAAQDNAGSGPVPLGVIIQRMQAAQAQLHPLMPYQVVREYQLFGANSSTSKSDVIVQMEFKPPTSKEYEIQKSSGSSRGVKIVRKILDHEVEQAKSTQSNNAINADNYSFTYLGETAFGNDQCYRLGLQPKRRDSDLIAGEALVDRRTFVIRQVEGELAKSPSWWVKDVHVKIGFAAVEGAWLQTGVEATADVRFIGPQKLTSRTLDHRSADVVAWNAGFVRRHDGGTHVKAQLPGRTIP